MNMAFVAIVGVILLLASFLAGLAIGMKSGAILPGGGSKACDAQDVLERLSDQGYLPPDVSLSEPVFEIDGNVVAVGSDYVEVEAILGLLDDASVFRVAVNPETVITRRTLKDAETLQREEIAFAEALDSFDPASSEIPEPPEPFVEETISLADIKSGDMINVSTLENIRESSNFTASAISIDASVLTPEPIIEDTPIEEVTEVPALDEEPPVEEDVEVPVLDEEPPVE